MSWDDVWKIVLTTIASMGGIGIVVVGVIKFAGKNIAERLAKKYDLKLNKELEAYKGARDKKVYISKTRFDTEFAIYRELSKSFFGMVKSCSFVFMKISKGPIDKEYDKKNYKTFVESIVMAQETLYSNAPFISEELYKDFQAILDLCNLQMLNCGMRLKDNYSPSPEDEARFDKIDYDRTEEIINNQEVLSNKIRLYLSKLDVMD